MASNEAARITKFDIHSNEGGTISLLGKGALPLVEYRECIFQCIFGESSSDSIGDNV